jgi:hypothetical protein
MARRALIVGINDYGGPPNDLRGCVPDADAMAKVISQHKDTEKNFDCWVWLDKTHEGKPITRPALRGAQQSRFDNFRYVFNNERPHEGLNNQVPASLYIPSAIRLPRKLPEFRYPKGLQLRRVNNSGDISWHKNRIFISEVFRFEELGVELITPGLYRVFFRDMEI